MKQYPHFRRIVDELRESCMHKIKALSHITELHQLVSKTIDWDENFISELTTVIEQEQKSIANLEILDPIKEMERIAGANDNGKSP